MKKILVIVLSIILTISIIGCSTSDLEDYRKAVIKTDDIKRGQMSYEIIIDTSFNTEGLSKEDIKNLNYFSKVDTKADMTFDFEKDKVISRNYFNFGGMGFDSSFYVDGDRMFMKMPIIGKYVEFSEMQGQNDSNVDLNGEDGFISDENWNKMRVKWNETLTKDDVFSGEDTILTTPDGEVKTTRYTIKLTEEQIKPLVNDYIDILSNDDVFMRNISKGMEMNTGEASLDSADDLLKKLKEPVNEITLEEFELQSYIDIDGYIVAENLVINLKINNTSDGKLESLKITVDINRWNIEKEQRLEFPELNEDNTLNMDNIDEGIPFIFEDMLKGKDNGEEK